MNNRKTRLAAAVGTALLAFGGSAQAQQPLEVKVSGQVSRALMYADDGVDKKTFNVDNEISGTRFRLTGAAGITPSLRAGVILEFDFQSNESSVVTMAAPSSAPALVERHMDAWIEPMGWGRLHLGQGDGAANGGVEVDISGTGIISAAAVNDIGGSLTFRAAGTGAAGPTISNVIDRQDFESRYDRVMYVTPTFGGLRGQVSNGTQGTFNVSEAALWYSGKLGALGDLVGALGYSKSGAAPGANKEEIIGGSVSWLHTSGISLTYGHTTREVPVVPPTASRDGDFDYLKLGYKFGKHAVSVDYAMGKDQALAGDDAKMYGVGYVWTPIGWAEFYAGYKVHSLDRPGSTFEDIALLTVGTRLKF